MASKEHFCKLETDSENTYYLHSKWSAIGRVKLFLSDGEMGWFGQISEATLKESYQRLKMDKEKFMEETKKALTRENVGGLTFKYDVKTSNDAVTLVWKKYLPADKIKIQLGQVEMKMSNDSKSVMPVMFEHCISAQSEYQEKLSSLASDNERLITERASALKRLEKHVTVKEDLEQDLYSKFVLIINEKKAKIRSLKEELSEALSGATQRSVEASTSRTPPDPEDGDDGHIKEDPDSEYDTDQEEGGAALMSPPPVKKSRVGIKQEGADTVDELLDDLMDDDVKPEPTQGRKGRVRGRQGGKQTSTRPVMPKVPSGDTPVQSSKGRRTSLRKTISDGGSNKSTENLDDLVSQI